MFCLLRTSQYCLESEVKCLRFVSSSRNDKIAKVVQQYLPSAEMAFPETCTESKDIDRPTKLECVKTIEDRHVNHRLSGLFAIEKTRCKHGFPRAYVQLPIHDIEVREPNGIGTVMDTKIQSGMIRLSCPYLVKGVDHFEYDGNGIPRLNALLNKTDNSKDTTKPARTHNAQPVKSGKFEPEAEELRKHFRDINAHWQGLRSSLISPEQGQVLTDRLGAEIAAIFASAGIGGLSGESVSDVKCLHLHVADSLLRGSGANKFGEWALEKLESEYQVNRNGCDDCWQQCSRQHSRTAASWWYTSVKNKSGIRSSLARRRVEKSQK